MTLAGTGTVDRLGIKVGYDVAGVPYETFIPAYVRICVPRRRPVRREVRPARELAGRQADRS